MEITLGEHQVEKLGGLIDEMNRLYINYPPEGDRVAKEIADELEFIFLEALKNAE